MRLFHANLMVESGDFCNNDVHAPYAMLDKKQCMHIHRYAQVQEKRR